MYTGIVQGTARIVAIKEQHQLKTLRVEVSEPLTDGLKIGASVAFDGCCTTVTDFDTTHIQFDLMEETLAVTTLDQKRVGDHLNIERSAKLGDEIGGHIMSGHISCLATLIDKWQTETNCQLTLSLPEQFMPYILPKGFVGVDGMSLTIGTVSGNHFNLHLIPETLAITTIRTKCLGDQFNIEIDSQTQAIVDTVNRVLMQRGL